MNDAAESPAPPRGSSLPGRVHLQPDGLLHGPAAAALVAREVACPLAGGPVAFTAVRLIAPPALPRPMLLTELRAWAEAADPAMRATVEARLAAIARPRAPFAGLDLAQPRLMGIVNVTPDSFSDGGDFLDPKVAVAHGLALRDAGADILDVGGESTRPGADPVPVDEELRRVLPVVRGLAEAGALVSIDTRRAAVMRAAVAAGARIVNDVTALTGDPDSIAAVAETGAAVVLMHMQGEPRTMQANPVYRHAPTDVYDFLAARAEACREAGIGLDRIAIDPGIGFGKTVAHNLEILEALTLLAGVGCAVVLGVSRKAFIGRIADVPEARARVPGSVAAGLLGLDRGVQILRVHDVAATRQAQAIREAVLSAGAPWSARFLRSDSLL